LPITHNVHSLSPDSTLYLPATHLTHGPPSRPDDPALHIQSVCLLLVLFEFESIGQLIHTLEAAATSPEYLPVAHTEHNASPVVVLYLPAAHETHVPPSIPVYPALHIQLRWSLLPAGDCEKSGHIVHCASPLSENVFTGHRSQSSTVCELFTVEK